MRLYEITETMVVENRMVWRRSGKSIKKGVRCTSGPRKGRVVSSSAKCGAPFDIKKRFSLKKTKAKFGKRLAKKAKRSKRINPASRKLARMNRPFRKRR